MNGGSVNMPHRYDMGYSGVNSDTIKKKQYEEYSVT